MKDSTIVLVLVASGTFIVGYILGIVSERRKLLENLFKSKIILILLAMIAAAFIFGFALEYFN